MVPVASWKDTAAADSVDSRERNWGRAVLLSTTSFMSFDVKTREESSKGALTRSKGTRLPTSAARAGQLILFDSFNFIQHSGGVAAV